MTIISIISTAVIGLLVIGFLIGLGRSWKKSLVRFGTLLVTLVLSIFLSPVISKALLSKFAKGTVLSVFGFSVDFKDVVENFAGEDVVNDIFATNGTTSELATSMMNLVMNLATFLLLFVAVSLLALAVYGIVVLVLHINFKKSGEEKKVKTWKGRIGGGFIGLASMMVICFAFFTPVFGTMSVCDEFLKQEKTTASALGPQNTICGELYYDKDKESEGIDNYIDKYAKIKKEYESSFAGFFFKYTGVNYVGTKTFNYLTEVESGDMKVNLSEEIVTVIKTYNLYREAFVENDFDLANNDSVDALIKLYEQANNSEIVKNYISEFVPKFANKWTNNEKFLGIECPVKGEMKPVFIALLDVFLTDNYKRIDKNIDTMFEVLKIANNYELIKNLQDGNDIVEYLKTDTGLVKDVVLKLSETPEFRNNLPVILNDTLKIAYEKVVDENGTAFEENELTTEQIEQINWNAEAVILQGLTNKTLIVVDNISADSQKNVLIDNLEEIGEIIDIARGSSMISKPLQIFLKGFVNSNKVELGEVKTKISSYIDTKWDYAANPEYKFAELFAVVEDTAKVADKLLSNANNLQLADIETALKTIIDNDEIKNTVSNIISDNIIGNLIGEENQDTAEVFTDMLDTFLENTNSSTIVDDLAAGQEIVNIVNDAKNNDNKLVLVAAGATDEEKQSKADEIVGAMAKSNAIMTMLETANKEGTSLKNITTGIEGDVSFIQNSILENTTLTTTQKIMLSELFS